MKRVTNSSSSPIDFHARDGVDIVLAPGETKDFNDSDAQAAANVYPFVTVDEIVEKLVEKADEVVVEEKVKSKKEKVEVVEEESVEEVSEEPKKKRKYNKKA